MPPATQQLTLTGGTELAGTTAGDPANTALLLLHGFPSSARTFRDVIPVLAQTVYVNAPELVSGLIIQNANAHRTGFGPGWSDTLA